MTENTEVGKVKFFDHKKGYGFVSTIDKQFKELGVKPTKEYTNASKEIYDIAEGSGQQMLKDLAKFKGLL